MTGHVHAPARAHRRQWPAVLGGLLLVALLALLPDLSGLAAAAQGTQLVHGRVTAVDALDPETGTQAATVELLDGARAGETVTADVESVALGTGGPPFAVGDEVVVQLSPTGEGGEFAAISDPWRLPVVGALLAGFALLVLLVAGWRGARALVALALTVGVVLKVLLPLLVAGWDPVPLAVAAGSAVTVATLVLTEGLRRTTLAAAIGTFVALLLTAVVAAAVTGLARFSLLAGSEEAGFLRGIVGGDIDLGGLLLAAVILGALGVLDDVTVTQATTVEELAAADPGASRATLAGRAMNVGRAHIAATVNTLVLAYVAASLPLLLLFAVTRQSPAALASSEVVAVEIVRSLVGSIGIVAAVPATTFAAAWLLGGSAARAARTGAADEAPVPASAGGGPAGPA